jgi:hypothetical protein
MRRRTNSSSRGNKQQTMKGITPEGIDFLKAATAAPDFQSLENRGVPDDFSGKSITKREYTIATVEAGPGSTWFIVTPSSGVSYWTTTDPNPGLSTGSVLSPILHPTANQLYSFIENAAALDFPGTNSSIVTDFRMIALSAEMACTTNAFNQYGSIVCYKAPFRTKMISRETIKPIQVADDQYSDDLVIEGAQCLINPTTSSDAYISAVKDGAYAVSMNREADFTWAAVRDGECLASQHSSYVDFAGAPASTHRLIWNGPLVAHDSNYDTIVFRVDVPLAVVSQSFVLKIWKTFEFQPTFNSLLHEVSHSAPLKDEAALTFYRELERELPIAVPIRDNPDFWDILLQGLDLTTELVSAIPGPIGMVGKGVHAIAASLVRKHQKRRKKKKASPKVSGRRRRKKK